MAIDKGEWTIYRSNKPGEENFVGLQSSDFNHDELLKMTGDYATLEEKLDYAQDLCDRLNEVKNGD